MFSTKINKYVAIIVLTLFLFVKAALPASLVFAEEITPTPTVTETPTPQPEEPESEVVTPTPTGTPTVTPTETPTPTPTETTQVNDGEVDNDISSVANTGENSSIQGTESAELTDESSIASESGGESSTSGTGGPSTIDTGDAVSIVDGENEVNTNSVNSKIVRHTINLFVNENGDIDLTDPFEIAKNIVVEEENIDSVVNVMATNSENYAVLSNDVVSIANTGSNTVEGSMEAAIYTGDSYSLVTLLNQVNFTIVGSTIHIVTINIFGELTGNIILPEFSSLGSCSDCGMSIATENEAEVVNNINSESNTGDNSIDASGDSEIETGISQSAVNVNNMINTNIIGMLLWNLTINVFGEWDGDFLGWGDIFSKILGGNGLALNYASENGEGGCSSCVGDVSSYNSAQVTNNINSSSNTGGNNINNSNNGSIRTGNAYSVVNLSNFINSNFINSTAFFGFINIFGKWSGNIGGASKFAVNEPIGGTNNEGAHTNTVSANSKEDSVRENGGLLSVTNTNNVGEYVNPGDTVTFFMDVTNTGLGKVYDTKLYLYLVNAQGQNVGGTVFDLKELGAGKKMKVSTGLVLANTTPGGYYTAVAVAQGVTGPDNTAVQGEALSNFLISGGGSTALLSDSDSSEVSQDKPTVLGVNNVDDKTGRTRDTLLLYLLLGLVTTYVGIRVMKKRDQLSLLFVPNSSFRKRLYTLRMFLI